MPSIKYSVDLSDSDRKALLDIVARQSPAKTILRANILLASDSNNKRHMTVAEIAETFNTSSTTVQNVRTCFANEGLEGTINRKKRKTPPVAPKVTGDIEARIIALACGKPPEGYNKWSVRLIAEKCVELNYVDSLSHMTVVRVLKKTSRPPLKCTPNVGHEKKSCYHYGGAFFYEQKDIKSLPDRTDFGDHPKK